MYRNVKVFVTVLGCCIGFHASATDIFRCTTSSEAVEYRDSPCAPGSGGKVAIQDDTPSTADQVAANNAIREMREQSKAIDARINALDTRFDVLLSKVIDVDNRLTRIEERLTK